MLLCRWISEGFANSKPVGTLSERPCVGWFNLPPVNRGFLSASCMARQWLPSCDTYSGVLRSMLYTPHPSSVLVVHPSCASVDPTSAIRALRISMWPCAGLQSPKAMRMWRLSSKVWPLLPNWPPGWRRWGSCSFSTVGDRELPHWPSLWVPPMSKLARTSVISLNANMPLAALWLMPSACCMFKLLLQTYPALWSIKHPHKDRIYGHAMSPLSLHPSDLIVN